MGSFIGYGKQWIEQDDIDSVVDVLKSDLLTQGPYVEKFEKEICNYTGAEYCVAVANATAALHLAVKALGIESGREGITSPNTFVSSSNSLIYNNLFPVFADIEYDSYNIDPEKVIEKITDNTKIIIPVHFAGRPCKMERISEITGEKNIFIIEDASHAIGSEYPDGKKVGCCKYSDMTVFSFHPVKTITTGEGGAITTNSCELYEKLCLLRSHGITKDKNKLINNPGPWYYEMQDLGFNYRITDIQAALGISQLRKLGFYKQRRNEIIKKYNESFSEVDWIDTPLSDGGNYCFHLYTILIDFNKIGKTRNEVMELLRKQNIGTQVHYIPVHIQPYYQKSFGYKEGDYPVSEKYYEKTLSIPLYPHMSNEDINYVIDKIKEVI